MSLKLTDIKTNSLYVSLSVEQSNYLSLLDFLIVAYFMDSLNECMTV